MEEAVRNVGNTYTDDEINQLAQRHFENAQVIHCMMERIFEETSQVFYTCQPFQVPKWELYTLLESFKWGVGQNIILSGTFSEIEVCVTLQFM